MNDEKFETIYRCHNPVEAEMLEDVLDQEGFDPHLIGTRNAALLGATDTMFALRIEVPARLAAEARELVEQVLAPSGFDDDGELIARADDDDDDDEESGGTVEKTPPAKKEKTPPKKKSRLIAAGIVFVFPGAGHFYAGRVVTGCFLASFFLVALVVLLGDELPSAGATLLVGELVLDLLGAQLAVVRHNRGGGVSRGKQVVFGITYMLALAAAAILMQRFFPEDRSYGRWDYETVDWQLAPRPELNIPITFRPLDASPDDFSDDELEELMRTLNLREINGLAPPDLPEPAQ